MIPKELKILHTIMCAQVLQNYLIDMKADNFFTKTFKYAVTNFIGLLKSVEIKFFDKYFSAQEDNTVELYDAYDAYIKTMAQVPLWEMQNVKDLVDAYFLDPKSCTGIAKKIHNNKK